MAYERDSIRRLRAYTPGEQPERGDVIKLNTNENPYPPPPQVIEAIRQVTAEQLRRYPSPTAQRFRETAGRVHGLTDRHVIATNGGDELLRLVVTVFCEPRPSTQPALTGGVAMAEPSYSLYPVLAEIQDTPVERIELDEGFALPGDFAAKLNQVRARVAFVVNPHAPSGRLQPLEQLRALAEQFDGVLVIDEAYVDFAERNALPLLHGPDALDNVLLLRSMSKGYSLAGLRFGYGLAHPELIASLDKARDSYNTDAVAQAAAIAALEHRDLVAETWRLVTEERARLITELTRRGFGVAPSQANFVLARVPAGGPEAGRLYAELKNRNILVRFFDEPRLSDKLRITVGTSEQDDRLLAAVDEILECG